MKKVSKFIFVGLVGAGLSGCASDGFLAKQFGYTPDKYIPVDKVQDYIGNRPVTAKQTIVKYDNLIPSRAEVIASDGLTKDPQIVSAYNNYVNGTGQYVVTGQHSKVYPYDPYAEPKIFCSLGYVCTITLEKGEMMTGTNKVGLDPVWNITDAKTGSGDDVVQIISLKPKPLKGQDLSSVAGASTNFVVPTNKRVYRFNLVIADQSQQKYEDISFYYPNDTVKLMNERLQAQYEAKEKKEKSSVSLYDDPTNISMTNANGDISINTNYTITSKDAPAWTPRTVWDNGAKTVIQMPKNISQIDLPNVMVIKDTTDQEVLNPRYRNGNYILDGIYKKIILFKVAGDNTTKVQVTITNNDYPSKK